MKSSHVFFVVLIGTLLCFIAQPISGYGFCHGKDNGNYADPDNCYGFISCSNGFEYKMDCPSNLKYDESSDRCDYADKVQCGGGSTFSCQGKPDGNYKDPDNCYGYIACSNGVAYNMPCPAGLKYNAVSNQCDYPNKVIC